MKHVDILHFNEGAKDGRWTITVNADGIRESSKHGVEGKDFSLIIGAFAFGRDVPKFCDDDEYHGCMFAQKRAGTQIIPGKFKGTVTLVSCNAQNVKADPRIKFVDCNEWAQVDVPDPPVVPAQTQAQAAVDLAGKNAVLDAVGKTYVKTYFGLTEIQAVK